LNLVIKTGWITWSWN